MDVQIKYNDENENLFCTYCKDRIQLGEKYVLSLEQLYDGEIVEKAYHMDCAPETPDETDEVYISPEA